ncbi:hypothetical protein ElyMa_004153900 [Elysia marginata]|uniref:Uncharacterized protein n=1 Tax=Elysia marginata TaxID=1093978 RepID=A0AAV4GJJ1_9GAST|nr:hypothetical protein ElyMa_004153900 [Elysia marginata]
MTASILRVTTGEPLFGGGATTQPTLGGGSSFFGGSAAGAANPVGFGSGTTVSCIKQSSLDALIVPNVWYPFLKVVQL